ncbi:MAG: aminoacyl-tRNA hydrolase [Spirochaetota bacterium]
MAQTALAEPGATVLVVGLMNPGDKYRFTRHNAGAMGLDVLWPAADYSPAKSLEGEVAEVSEGSVNLVLLKPHTFMNLSGQAVLKTMKKFRIAPQQLVVLHDEVELPVGTVKHKFGGGHKGHNGLRSIMGLTGSADFHRIRIGVGRPHDDRHGIADYLLAFQPPAERVTKEQLQPVFLSLLPQ